MYMYIYIHKLYALFVDDVSTVVSRFAPAKILNGHFFSLKSILFAKEYGATFAFVSNSPPELQAGHFFKAA